MIEIVNHQLDGFWIIAGLIVDVIADGFEMDGVCLALLYLISCRGPRWKRTAKRPYRKIGKSPEVVRVRGQYVLVHFVGIRSTDDGHVRELAIFEQAIQGSVTDLVRCED